MVRSFLVLTYVYPLPSPLASDNLSSLTALMTALDGLDDLCQAVEEKYVTSLVDDKYEQWVERS